MQVGPRFAGKDLVSHRVAPPSPHRASPTRSARPNRVPLRLYLPCSQAWPASDSLRRDVLKRLEKLEVRQDWIACVRDYMPTGDRDRAEFLGEELPVGLELGTLV